jgi:hypothetical protein
LQSATRSRLAKAVLASAREEAEVPDACVICLEGSNQEQLGYIVSDSNQIVSDSNQRGRRGHPDKIHLSCLQQYVQQYNGRCPLCRGSNVIWGPKRPPAQGGRSSKSKTRTRTKSKTRRLRRSRNNSRKQ